MSIRCKRFGLALYTEATGCECAQQKGIGSLFLCEGEVIEIDAHTVLIDGNPSQEPARSNRAQRAQVERLHRDIYVFDCTNAEGMPSGTHPTMARTSKTCFGKVQFAQVVRIIYAVVRNVHTSVVLPGTSACARNGKKARQGGGTLSTVAVASCCYRRRRGAPLSALRVSLSDISVYLSPLPHPRMATFSPTCCLLS